MLKGENRAFLPLTIPGFVAFEPCKNRNLERGYYMLPSNHKKCDFRKQQAHFDTFAFAQKYRSIIFYPSKMDVINDAL